MGSVLLSAVDGCGEAKSPDSTTTNYHSSVWLAWSIQAFSEGRIGRSDWRYTSSKLGGVINVSCMG